MSLNFKICVYQLDKFWNLNLSNVINTIVSQNILKISKEKKILKVIDHRNGPIGIVHVSVIPFYGQQTNNLKKL